MSRVVLVTGAAGGIGRALTTRLVAEGCTVVAVDQLDEVTDLGRDRVLPVVADVCDRAALARTVDVVLNRFGRVDAAVAAAAVISGGRPLWETDAVELDRLFDVDVRGVWNTAAVAVPAMLAGPDPSGCRFVAVASAAGHHGMYGLAAYSIAKHGVIGLVRGLAADLVGTGVTAAAVSPGSTRTPMLDATAAFYGLPDPELFASHQLLRRLIDPEEVAGVIAFCCSREGAVVNGSVVHADGGFS